jgi:serine/threonine-protein kinase
MKEMSDTAIANPIDRQQAISAFRREAQLLAAQDHSNLPSVADFFSEGGCHYLVMDFVEGETLESVLSRQATPFSEAEVLDWASQLCDVLCYLHAQRPPVIFRDLKPGNIMLARDGRLKLIDFGIARFFKPGQPGDTVCFGTPGYSPPEQYGRGQTDHRSDIYALGVTLHQLLTNHDPGATPFALPKVRQLNPSISPGTEAAINRATQLNPTRRFQSITEMKQALGIG